MKYQNQHDDDSNDDSDDDSDALMMIVMMIMMMIRYKVYDEKATANTHHLGKNEISA